MSLCFSSRDWASIPPSDSKAGCRGWMFSIDFSEQDFLTMLVKDIPDPLVSFGGSGCPDSTQAPFIRLASAVNGLVLLMSATLCSLCLSTSWVLDKTLLLCRTKGSASSNGSFIKLYEYLFNIKLHYLYYRIFTVASLKWYRWQLCCILLYFHVEIAAAEFSGTRGPIMILVNTACCLIFYQYNNA